MALASKQSEPFYVTTGGGADEINAARKTTLINAFTDDKGRGNKQLIDDNTLGPIVFNVQRMQDDIDELRRFVTSASEARVGTTFDASTDFTIGATEITDGTITLTPSTGDTAQLRATANGALSIATNDATGSLADITITADGKSEIDAREITLDSGGNIELETGSVANYINTTGVLRSGNQGDIQYVSSEYYIPITATDFQGAADTRGGDQWGMDIDGTWMSNNRAAGYVEKLIPLGFKATGCIVYGDADGSGDNEFRGYEGAINANTHVARGTATTVNATSDFTTQGGADITGDGLKTCRILLVINERRDSFYGGKIILEKV